MKKLVWIKSLVVIGIALLISSIILARFGFISEYVQSSDIEWCPNNTSATYFLIFGFRCGLGLISSYHDVLITLATIVLAGFTISLVHYTRGLFESAEASRKDAEKSLRAVQRASIGAIGLSPLWEFDTKRKIYNWRFRPQWQNTGNTPTRRMQLHVNYELRTSTLPDNFRFDYETEGIGTGLIPPKLALNGGIIPPMGTNPITPENILDIESGKLSLYIWGWAKYYDIFDDSDEHITRFCWLITPIGNPKKFVPGSSKLIEQMGFPYLYHTKGNCTDEECKAQS